MSDYVVLYRTYDPIEGRFLVDYLRHNGIPALFLGTQNAAGIGMAQFMVQLRVEVPETDVERAKDLMLAFYTEYEDSLTDTPHELKTVATRLHELKEELGLAAALKKTNAEAEPDANAEAIEKPAESAPSKATSDAPDDAGKGEDDGEEERSEG